MGYLADEQSCGYASGTSADLGYRPCGKPTTRLWRNFKKAGAKAYINRNRVVIILARRPKIVKTGVNHYEDLPDIARRLYWAMAQRL
jgi:hypothetical protein